MTKNPGKLPPFNWVSVSLYNKVLTLFQTSHHVTIQFFLMVNFLIPPASAGGILVAGAGVQSYTYISCSNHYYSVTKRKLFYIAAV